MFSINKYLTIFFATAVFLTGCKKSNKAQKDSAFFSKKNNKQKSKASASAFDLDQESIQSFALDDSLSKHSTKQTNSSNNPLLSWENADQAHEHQFKTIYFEFDKDSILPSQEAALNYDIIEAKKMIKDGKMLVIEGHACHSAGSAAYNLAISERRARYIAQRFAQNGIDASHIKIAPRGQEMPIRKGGNRQEQAVNRRVEIYAIAA